MYNINYYLHQSQYFVINFSYPLLFVLICRYLVKFHHFNHVFFFSGEIPKSLNTERNLIFG